MKKLEEFKSLDGKVVKSPAYGFSITYDYTDLKKRFLKLAEKFTVDKEKCDIVNEPQLHQDIEPDSVVVNKVTPGSQETGKKKVIIRKCPKESAQEFEIGYKKKAPNGAVYIVKEYTKSTGKTYKKWVKTDEVIIG